MTSAWQKLIKRKFAEAKASGHPVQFKAVIKAAKAEYHPGKTIKKRRKSRKSRKRRGTRKGMKRKTARRAYKSLH